MTMPFGRLEVDDCSSLHLLCGWLDVCFGGGGIGVLMPSVGVAVIGVFYAVRRPQCSSSLQSRD